MNSLSRKKIYLIIGAPASGKATIGQKMSEAMKGEFISWGKLKESNRKDTQESRKKLFEQIDSWLESQSENLIISGFPKTQEEAEEMLSFMQKNGIVLAALININITFPVMVKRLLGTESDKEIDMNDARVLKINNEYENYLNTILPAYNALQAYSESHFSINGEDEEMFVLSAIIENIKTHKKEHLNIFVRTSEANLPTEYGTFKIITYQSRINFEYHVALVKGNIEQHRKVPMRIHSSCITGDIFHSLKCDCGEQLDHSLKYISETDCGILIYLFQEGRGINIINKVSAYKLQEQGYDTVEANLELGLPEENREYLAVKDILKDLKVKTIVLISNNPDKRNKLLELGVQIEDIVPLIVEPNEFNANYLNTKKEKMNHKL